MEYKKLLAITGKSGLFELKSSRADGGIVRSLDEATPKFVSSRTNSFSQLEAIEVFTIRENVKLTEIFIAMDESSEELPAEKDDKAISNYFIKVYQDLDFDRVYTSDMKKMVKWFKILKKYNIDFRSSLNQEETQESEASEVES